MRNGHCNFCQSQELLKKAYSTDGHCRNCGADLRANNLIRDKDNWLICRYCGWPIRQKTAESITGTSTIGPPPIQTSTLSSVISGGLGLIFMGIFALVILTILGGFSGISGIFPTSNVTKITTNINNAVVTGSVFLSVLAGLILIGFLFAILGLARSHTDIDVKVGSRMPRFIRRIFYRTIPPKSEDEPANPPSN